ncbi:hypothetical protein [Ruoffia tabacinasalis]|uniref:hypothetical protein n=1 Tax=Ruoffia tabacinasalis TaxID=87458 RepID=UPI0030D36A1B
MKKNLLKFTMPLLATMTMLYNAPVHAENDIAPTSLTDDQSYLLDMISDTPLYFDLTIDSESQSVNIYFERLSREGEWEVEQILDFPASQGQYTLLIDYHYPFQAAIKSTSDTEDTFTFQPSLTMYPSESVIHNQDTLKLSGIALSEPVNLTTSDKHPLVSLFLVDQSKPTNYHEVLSTFDYNNPNLEMFDEVESIYTITIELTNNE